VKAMLSFWKAAALGLTGYVLGSAMVIVIAQMHEDSWLSGGIIAAMSLPGCDHLFLGFVGFGTVSIFASDIGRNRGRRLRLRILPGCLRIVSGFLVSLGASVSGCGHSVCVLGAYRRALRLVRQSVWCCCELKSHEKISRDPSTLLGMTAL